jgi:hypothetical protein
MKAFRLLPVIAALALALLMPADVLAAATPWFGQVERAGCSDTGGAYGFGKVVLRVQFGSYNDWDDPALPTPNYINVVSSRQEKVDGVWVPVERQYLTTAVHPDGSGWFGVTAAMKYPFPTANHPLTRIVIRGQFWDDLTGTDVRLHTIRVLTKGC